MNDTKITKYILSVLIGDKGFYSVMTANKPIEYSKIMDKEYSVYYLDNLITLHKRIDADKTAVFMEKQYIHPGNSIKSNFEIGYGFGLLRGCLYNNFNNFYIVDCRMWKTELLNTYLNEEERYFIRKREYNNLSELCSEDYRDFYLSRIRAYNKELIHRGRLNSYYLFNKLGLYKFIEKDSWKQDCLITSLMLGYWASNFAQQLTDLREIHDKYKRNNQIYHAKVKEDYRKIKLDNNKSEKILTK